MDYYTLPQSAAGFKYLLCLVDSFTRWTEIRAVKAANAHNTCSVLRDAVFYNYGPCEIIQSDGGSHFDCEEVRQLCKEFNVTQHITTPYNPQSNGIVERLNSEIHKLLSIMAKNQIDKWEKFVPRLQWLINSSKNSSIGMSPLEAFRGHQARTRLEASVGTPPKQFASLKELQTVIGSIHERISERSQAAFQKRKQAYDSGRKLLTLNTGDAVLLYRDKIPSKLHPHWQVGFTFLRYAHDNPNVALLRNDNLQKEVTAHVRKVIPLDISRCSPSDLEQFLLPDNCYIVDSIKDHKYDESGDLQLLVQWRDQSDDDATWEPHQALAKVTIAQQYISSKNLPLRSPAKAPTRNGKKVTEKKNVQTKAKVKAQSSQRRQSAVRSASCFVSSVTVPLGAVSCHGSTFRNSPFDTA
jgi:hypothetical protein